MTLILLTDIFLIMITLDEGVGTFYSEDPGSNPMHGTFLKSFFDLNPYFTEIPKCLENTYTHHIAEERKKKRK